MLLNAWTQTTSEDFELLRSLDPHEAHDPHVLAENCALREKVRYLESKLQEHTDLLTQIHAASARMQQATSTLTPPPPSPQQQQQQQHPQLLTPPSSVICAAAALPQMAPQRAQVVDYKIIAAAGADCNDADAIEIRLAAESLNSLSTSADSERLEICLGGGVGGEGEGEERMKRESTTTPLQLSKRCKLEENMTSSPSTPNPLQVQQSLNTFHKLPSRRSNAKWKDDNNSSGSAGSGEQIMVSIGPNNTCVPAQIFENINWSVSSLATRKLLVAIFDRETLATHSMTGKPSPAFKDQRKPLKQMLDPLKIQDIIFAVTHKSSASEKEVRNAITTKCADENKMMKIQKGKRNSNNNNNNISSNNDKENMLI